MSSGPTDDNVQARVFAVVGATGQQGGATTRALLTAGAKVRALVRDLHAPRAQFLAHEGAALVRADLDDPASLRAAFSSVDGVFAMTTSATQRGPAGEVEQGKAMGDAALAAEVPHVVYSSVGGAERHTGIPHFESKRRVEEHLTALGLSTTFVRPVFFMDNFLRYLAPQPEANTLVVRLPLPPGIPLQLIATDDIGRVAAAALLDPARVGPSIEIAGDERTGEQLAAAYGDQASLPARFEPIPLEFLANDLDQQAMFAWFAQLPAFQADFAATRRLAPAAQDFATWLARHRPVNGWGLQQAVPPQATGGEVRAWTRFVSTSAMAPTSTPELEEVTTMSSSPIRDPLADHLITPQNAALVVIDYQPAQFATVRSMDPDLLLKNIVSTVKAAQTFGLPIVHSTVNVASGQVKPTVPELAELLADTPPIDRTSVNSWEDADFVNAVRATGRRKLIFCALWTEVCMAFAALDALREGYEVYPVVDAIAGTSVEAHRAGIERVVQAGGRPIGWVSLACELQRDWARHETVPAVVQIVLTDRLLKE